MNLKDKANGLRRLMMIGEAAEFCGVSKETLRNWDRDGKLIAERHPVTGYRYYAKKDVERFVKRLMKERSRG